MAGKDSKSLRLSAALEAELDSLIGTWLGDRRSEIITFVLKDWFLNNQERINEIKARSHTRIDADA